MLENLMKSRMQWMIRKEKFLQRFLGKTLNVKKSWQDTPAQFKDLVAFLNWFDSTNSLEDCLKKSQEDWAYRFAQTPQYQNVNKGQSLEIGFGGGRLLLQAAKVFKKALGVDIHESFAMTREFLQSQGCANYELHKRDDLSRVPDRSVDFIYSFIVFQHFDSLSEVQYYLNHIKRILAPGGYAHVYYGKNEGKGVNVTSDRRFQLRDCSLFIEPTLMRDLVSQQFDLIEYQDELYRDAAKKTGRSGQAYVIFKNLESSP